MSLSIKNTSQRAGEEIVQLYIRDLASSRVRPVKELKDFKKILLQPGESRMVSFNLPASKLSFYDENGETLLETGAFKVYVGPDSEHLKEVDLILN